ncbi:MAG: ABC transporter substrate-binding protein [Treponema sp.]|nr:ABC transporter substrate-binding protein [Treponema sp.]
MKDVNGNSIICEESNKICYTQKEAGFIINSCRRHGYKSWGLEQKNKPMRKYFCNSCGFWHTTHHKTYIGKKPKSKRLKILMSAMLFLLVITGVTGCSKKHVQQINASVQITDYAERTVTLSKAAEKVVVMADNSLVVVKQLKAIDKVLALDSKTKGYLPLSILNTTNPELGDLPDVGKTKSPNYEYIISLNPDLILFKGNKELSDMLQEKTGVPVACIISKGDYDFELYTKIGTLLGKQKEAEHLVKMFTEQKSALEKITAGISDSQKKSAYIVVQNSKSNLFKTMKASLSLELAGVRNVAANANKVDDWGFAEISKEEFLNYTPALIFLDKPSSPTEIQINDLQSDSIFSFLDAVKQKDIYLTHSFSLPKDYVYVIAEAYYYAHLAYPEHVTESVYKKAINTIFETAYSLENYYENWTETLR